MANLMTPVRVNKAFLLTGILLIFWTVAVYRQSLSNGFVSWDDQSHILEYPPVRHFSLSVIPRIFTELIQNTYIPLTQLTFGLENKFFGLNPFVFHLNNLILHILSVLLIFGLGCRLGLSTVGAGLGALIFAIHPMHVESVAWATERKDVLYSFFYLSGLHVYLSHIQWSARAKVDDWTLLTSGYFYGTMSLFLIALLAKPMAISFPLILILIDYFVKRPISRYVWLEKAPFFVMAVALGLISYLPSARYVGLSGLESLLTWSWTAVFYLAHFLFHTVSVPLYGLPDISGVEVLYYWLSVALLGVILVSLRVLRRFRWYWFALMYYFLSAFFLFRFDQGLEVSLVADRYMYLPSLGVCFLLGHIFSNFLQNTGKYRLIRILIIIGLLGQLGLWSIKTVRQTAIWQNSYSLWDYQMTHGRPVAQAYNNMANYYQKLRGLDQYYLSSDDDKPIYNNILGEIEGFYLRSIQISPDFWPAHYNLGNFYLKLGKGPEAARHLQLAMREYPQDAQMRIYLGEAYSLCDQPYRALMEFSRALTLEPDREDVYLAIINSLHYAATQGPEKDRELYRRARSVFFKGYQLYNSSQGEAQSLRVALEIRRQGGDSVKGIKHLARAAQLEGPLTAFIMGVLELVDLKDLRDFKRHWEEFAVGNYAITDYNSIGFDHRVKMKPFMKLRY